MSKSLSLHKYPGGMLDVIEAVIETSQPCTIPFPSEKDAKRERFQFYGLIRALKASQHSLAPKVGQLVFSLAGPSRNILTIELGKPEESDFYARVADKHLSQHQK